ncbi:MAG: ArsR family transcriptional regulator [Anaerolineae bacterium]|nr:MAG: ArsR family transcriptional regulator [Anaerolineae bacterium]
MALIKGIQDTPAGTVVEILQRYGPLSIKEIEEHMGVTKTAVRQQLTALMAEGLVSTRGARGCGASTLRLPADRQSP